MGEFIDRLLLEKHRILRECHARSTPGTKDGINQLIGNTNNAQAAKRRRRKSEKKRAKAEAEKKFQEEAANGAGGVEARAVGSSDAVPTAATVRHGDVTQVLTHSGGKESERKQEQEMDKEREKLRDRLRDSDKDKEHKEKERERLRDSDKDKGEKEKGEKWEREKEKIWKLKEKEKLGRHIIHAKISGIKAKAKERRKEKEKGKETKKKEREKEKEKEREREREREMEREKEKETERQQRELEEKLEKEREKVWAREVEELQERVVVPPAASTHPDEYERDNNLKLRKKRRQESFILRQEKDFLGVGSSKSYRNPHSWNSVDEIDEYQFSNRLSQDSDQIDLQQVDLSEMKAGQAGDKGAMSSSSGVIKKHAQEKVVHEEAPPVAEEKFVALWLCFQLALKVAQFRSSEQLLTPRQIAHFYYQAGEFLSTWASCTREPKSREDMMMSNSSDGVGVGGSERGGGGERGVSGGAVQTKTLSGQKKKEMKENLAYRKVRLFNSAAQMYEAALKAVPCVSDGSFFYTITNVVSNLYFYCFLFFFVFSICAHFL